MTSQTTIEVILDGPDQYHPWFANTKGSVPRDLWKYFDPESTSIFIEPEQVTFSTVKEGAQTLQQLSTAEKTLFTQLRNLYNTDVSQYQRFLSEEAKLRKLILGTVSLAKRSQLKPDNSVREWIKNLQASTKPSNAQMQGLVRARHRAMMGSKYLDWPTGGPDKWVMEWQKLMSDCETWCPPLYQLWASDFNLVWGEVPGAQRLCDRLIEAVNKDELLLEEWSIYRVSMELKQAWDQKAIRNGMRVAGKARITKAAFAVEPRFDGIEASKEKVDECQAEPSAPSVPLNSRKRYADTESDRKSSHKRSRRDFEPCWGCEGSHNPFTCVLIKGSNPRKLKVSERDKKIFEEKMRDSDFAGQIRKLREAEEIRRKLQKRRNE